ncbi:hypothetical protein [Geoalkalibacter subterraneus]|uniref:Response regulatory domain-containing protein n=1 Tax=Geoalkalibacter subterraneus TaxID=483547 RepID=A0A0B5FH12_9BACT|nr:hypothetical protein [Geoalkalibacter subterraneus]AJF07442.1 hypothetical protein GSUB_13960 [Geoalkalibacter subterraneus]
MSDARVLMLDWCTDACRETVFLLRLRGCQVTVVRDGHEMLNWFFSQMSSDIPFDALVVNRFQRIEEVEEIFETLRMRGVQTPVLLVEREDLPRNFDIEQWGGRTCHPRDLVGSLTGFLQLDPVLQ